MAEQWKQQVLWLQGLMLETSEARLEHALQNMDGIRNVKASYLHANVCFDYDPDKTKLKTILKTIGSLGYIASEHPREQTARMQPPPESSSDHTALPAKKKPESLIRKVLKIEGMTCTSCEMRIENRLKKLPGIRELRVSYADGTAKVGYDPRIIKMSEIIEVIEKLDYTVANNPQRSAERQNGKAKSADKLPINQLIGIGIVLMAGYLLLKNTVGFHFIPNISQNMGYGILFVVGLVTSLHCVAMCGGINLSQCVSYSFSDKETTKAAKLKPSLLYNAGRVISYTVVGGIVGALGSVVSFSGTAKGIVAILAGIFMLIMGLNMLNVFPALRKITPHMPKIFSRKLGAGSGKHGPFFVGLFNGLMPCGPLQAMQIYALGTGSFAKGALSMFVFSLGTVPLMFGFGAISSFLSSKFTHRMMKVSAALVMVLGIIMLGRGFSLSGINLVSALSPKAASGTVATVQGNTQNVVTQLGANSYTPITVQKGIPVRWTIKAAAGTVNGCNGILTIPKYNVTKSLQEGNNEIDFTPKETGTINYTCSMGMISSTISVVDDVSNVSAKAAASAAAPAAPGGSAAGGVGVAKVSGNTQDVTVTVGTTGYTPSILVLQKGIPATIHFKTGSLSSCNSTVIFPELGGQVDLYSQKATPTFTPQSDFSFVCGMGMLRGYVKVVDDINSIDLAAIQSEAKNYVSSGGGMACCQ